MEMLLKALGRNGGDALCLPRFFTASYGAGKVYGVSE